MDNEKRDLTTDKLATLPLDHNWYQKLASNFEIIQSYLDKLDTDELEIDDFKNEIADISGKINIYETNIVSIVNILSDYDVPIQIINGKVVDTKEGE
ncbi:hypothetical protein [Lactiplantibacillus plantarum]